MPLEVLTNAPSGGWHSVTNRELKCRPVKMPAPTGCAVFQGDGGKQVIYLQIKQQETFPHKAHMKGQTWRAPDQTKQRILFLRTSWLHCRCGIENLFGTLSGLFFFFLIMEEIILACVTNSPKLYFYPIPTWMENGRTCSSGKGARVGRWCLGIRLELGRAGADRTWDSRLWEEMNCAKHGGRVRRKVDKILPF